MSVEGQGEPGWWLLVAGTAAAFQGHFFPKIMIFHNPLFYFNKTEFFAGIASYVIKANMWPTLILASRQVISGFWCENGAVFRGGSQGVFDGELHSPKFHAFFVNYRCHPSKTKVVGLKDTL